MLKNLSFMALAEIGFETLVQLPIHSLLYQTFDAPRWMEVALAIVALAGLVWLARRHRKTFHGFGPRNTDADDSLGFDRTPSRMRIVIILPERHDPGARK
jgi:hypothetical protein